MFTESFRSLFDSISFESVILDQYAPYYLSVKIKAC